MIAHVGSLTKIDTSVFKYRINVNTKDVMKQTASSPVDTSHKVKQHRQNARYVVSVSLPIDNLSIDEYHEALMSYSYPTTKRHKLDVTFSQEQYDFISHLFCILDTDNRGSVNYRVIFEFVILRCPVFRRRDSNTSYDPTVHAPTPPLTASPTFNEIWHLTIQCSRNSLDTEDMKNIKLGVEGWMIFCRFIVIAQSFEVKRSFKARHLQQTMQSKKEGKNSELVLVQVPPPDPPSPLDYKALIEMENLPQTIDLDMPEIDVEFSVRDEYIEGYPVGLSGSLQAYVQVSPFNSTANISSSISDYQETYFVISYYLRSDKDSVCKHQMSSRVKRSLSDFIWLHEIFISHKIPGDLLWGHIIPPFPIKNYSPSVREDDSYRQPRFTNMTADSALSAATTGIGVLSSLAKSAKSFLGDIVSKSDKSSLLNKSRLSNSFSTLKSQRTWSDEHCLSFAFERYLNYILENPVLAESFAVHVTLKASGAGLECAKSIIERRKRQVTNELTGSRLETNGATTSSNLKSTVQQYYGNSGRESWVRTAAQAALSVHVHALLQTTGNISASVKLQHASIPFISSRKGMHEDDELHRGSPPSWSRITTTGTEFENGVVCVDSELDLDEWGDVAQISGYDLLPSPLPPSERSALCAGKVKRPCTVSIQDDGGFLYGEFECSKNYDDSSVLSCPHTLGDVSLDSDIDKLRDIIYGLRSNLEKCLTSLVVYDKSLRRRMDLHLRILTILDTWEGMCRLIVPQRALLNSACSFNRALESYKLIADKAVQDLSWQMSLASSAVATANEVRCTVHASQTAANAKEASNLALKRAVEIVNAESDLKDPQAALDKMTTLKQQAMHSAIVEYEALCAKQNSSTSLAHDVRTWNVHRKREVFSTCWNLVSSQQKAAHHFTQTWEELRDGLIHCFQTAQYLHPSHDYSSMSSTVESRKLLHELILADSRDTGFNEEDFIQSSSKRSSSAGYLDEMNGSTSLVDLSSSVASSIQFNLYFEHTQSNKVSLENRQNFQGSSLIANSDKGAEDTEESFISQSLSLEEKSISDFVTQEFFVDSDSANNKQVTVSDIATDECDADPSSHEMIHEDFLVDAPGSYENGVLNRISSMESLINGLMTWSSNDAPLAFDL